MSEEQGQDKSFDATPEKIRRARQKGNVPNSPELLAFCAMLGVGLGFSLCREAGITVTEVLAGFLLHPEDASAQLLGGAGNADPVALSPLRLVAVIVAPGAVLVLLALFVQRALVFAPSKVKPDIKRINPIEGIKKKYGPAGMGEFLKSAAKILLTAIIGAFYIWTRRDVYVASLYRHAMELPQMLLQELVIVVAIAAGIALLVSLIDVPSRYFSHAKQLRMSRQEVKDETKEMEGDPHQKQVRQRRARDLSAHQMLRDTAHADVVIVNPTHFAVALKWERSETSVPICVAKGVDEMAMSIIKCARAAGVPLREDPPCARALHASLNVGDPIEPLHFAAVAAAIRFADNARAARMGAAAGMS